MDESASTFTERWKISLSQLATALQSPAFDSELATKEVQRLSEELTERAGGLPSYELGRCERELKGVLDCLNEKKNKTAPKSKFSFRRSTTTSPSVPTTAAPIPRALDVHSGLSPSRPNSSPSIPRTTLTISARSQQYLCSSSLPSSGTTTSEALLLLDLTDCLVDLLPSSTADAKCSAPSAGAFPAIYLSGLKGCTVLLPKIDGSVMINDCRDCQMVLGSHQFRMHDSSACRLYLDTKSTPIIERCDKLIFDRYPEGFDPASPVSTTMSDASALFVQDFDYPFATLQNPSPNWRLAIGDDEAADWVVESSVDGRGEVRYRNSEGRRQIWEAKMQAKLD